MGRFFLSLMIFFFAVSGNSQLPATDIYMFHFSYSESEFTVGKSKFLTHFNQNGYNNQPSFFSDKDIYLTSSKYDSAQTEIIRLDTDRNLLYRVTQTPESEYSPTLHPDKEHFTTVRVEQDGTTQSLRKYPLDQKNGGERLFPGVNTLGYHCWIDEENVAMFLLPEPFTLSIGNTRTGEVSPVLDRIGRCLKMNEEKNLLFVHKIASDLWYIKSYDPEAKKAKIIIPTLPGREDFEILKDGSLIMADGSVLYRYKAESDDDWIKVIDFSKYGIQNISRIAATDNKLVVVSSK